MKGIAPYAKAERRIVLFVGADALGSPPFSPVIAKYVARATSFAAKAPVIAR